MNEVARIEPSLPLSSWTLLLASLRSCGRRFNGVALFALFALTLFGAWLLRFGTDDAFISFVYARSLVRGEGLTWFGDHVEGYTNFLWVLWVALGLKLGFAPLGWAWFGSLGAMALVLASTHRFTLQNTGSAAVALAATGLLACNFTFLAFGTSGLETMPQTAILTLATCEVDRLEREPTSPSRLFRLSLLGALAMAMRLDSAVICAVIGVVAISHLVRRRASPRMWLALVAPGALILAAWFSWKLAYYGHILPNTFFAKAQLSSTSLLQGVYHVGRFLRAYWLWPVLLLGLANGAYRRALGPLRLPLCIVGAWFGYVVLVGGDFMEYRFFVPVLPMLSSTVVRLALLPLVRWGAPVLQLGLVCVALCIASVRHGATFRHVPDRSLDSVAALGTFYGLVPDGDWGRLGRPLKEVLSGSNALLACTGAGSIPYYSELPTVDQLGLVDPWVARHGKRPDPSYARPGHQRFATLEYLKRRKVNLVIGSAVRVRSGYLRSADLTELAQRWPFMALGFAVEELGKVTLLAIPIGNDDDLLAWYLTSTPNIDARIKAAGWDRVELPTAQLAPH